MSNIYIQEPPTSGKVLLKTSVGDIDIELWCRETPKTCRNFIQLCMEGYYNGTIFHRVVKGFIAQGGDPNGDGTGGESIYGEPFKDEFHSRLRFSRRGLLAMANSGRDDNGSQFFFTLAEAPELQNKHTIFGKVAGDTIYNMLKLEEGVIDHNERPHYPQKINKTEILLNPFDDIQPRITKKKDESEKLKKKKEKGIKNFGLLSFGAEAEEDEEETDDFVQKLAGKPKSTHDVLDDPLLSKKTVVITKSEEDDGIIEHAPDTSESKLSVEKKTELVRNKLKTSSSISNEKERLKQVDEPKTNVEEPKSDSDEDFSDTLEKERRVKRQKEADKIRDEIKALKKEYKSDRISKEKSEKETKATDEKEHENEMVQQYISEQRKYSHLKKEIPKKGALREKQTLELLNKFKSKLENVRKLGTSDAQQKPGSSSKKDSADIDEEGLNDDTWLSHTLHFDNGGEILAKDASTKKDDWHDIYDPRNPINKRKRGEDDRRQSRKERR